MTQQLFFNVKGQQVNILDFASHTVSVATVPVYSCSVKTTIDSLKMKDLAVFNKKAQFGSWAIILHS